MNIQLKIKIAWLLVSLVFLIQAKSAEPADSYLSALIEDAGGNLWWVYPKEIGGNVITPPKGGYIFRIVIDLDGDGIDEVFLTTDGSVMKNGASWALYRRDALEHYAKLSDDVWLRESLWVKMDDGINKYSYLVPQDRETGLETIHSFWIDASGNYHASTRQLTEAQSKAINGEDQDLLNAAGLPDEAKIAQYLTLGNSVALNIQKVLVGKLYQDANATWRAMNSHYSLSQQYLDPADAADIVSLESWTPPSNP